MGDFRYETALDENQELKRALNSTKRVLERTLADNNSALDDYDTLKKIHEDFKQQFERVRKENDTMLFKYSQLNIEKKELEKLHESSMRNLRDEIEDRQREIADLQALHLGKQDIHLERAKLLHEVEQPFQSLIEAKEAEIEQLKDLNFEQKRQVDLLNSKYESIKIEAERDIRDLKSRHQQEMNDLVAEIDHLQEQLDEKGYVLDDKNYRKKYEDLRTKNDRLEKEFEELVKQRDRAKEEKHNILIKFGQQMESERAEREEALTNQKELMRDIAEKEQEAARLQNHILIQEQDINRISTECSKWRKQAEENVREVEHLQQQLKLASITVEGKSYHNVNRMPDSPFSKERNQAHVEKVIKENDSYKNRVFELESQNRTVQNQYQQEIEVVRGRNHQLEAERNIDKQKVAFLEEQLHLLKSDNQRFENELQHLQKINQDLRTSKSPVEVQKPRLEMPIYPLLPKPVEQYPTLNESNLQAKNEKLKNKLKSANNKIITLLNRKTAESISQNNSISGIYRPKSRENSRDPSREVNFVSQENEIKRLQEKYSTIEMRNSFNKENSTQNFSNLSYHQNLSRIIEKYK